MGLWIVLGVVVALALALGRAQERRSAGNNPTSPGA